MEFTAAGVILEDHRAGGCYAQIPAIHGTTAADDPHRLSHETVEPLPTLDEGGQPPPREFAAPETQTAKVRVDQRKHRRKVTVVWGPDPEANDLPDVLAKLKAACGAGGSLQEQQLEIQGDHAARVREKLCEIGFRVK